MRHLFLIILLLCSFSLISAYNTGDFPPITIQNAANLQELAVLGDGAMNDAVAWLPDGSIVVGASRGVYIYENLQAEARFIELELNVQTLLAAGEILFFSDGTSLYSYDVVNQQILYSLEGQRPLAVSNQGAMLAYEVDMGVRVLEIATGTVLYGLSYEGILEPEYNDESSTLEHRFVFAQFYPDDERIIVRYITNRSAEMADAEGSGTYNGTASWMFNDLSQSQFGVQGFYGDPAPFVAIDADGDFFAVSPLNIISLSGDISIPVNLQRDESLSLESDNIGYAVQGNYLAVPVIRRSENNWQYLTRIWNVGTGEFIANLPVQGRIAFSADASKVAIGRHIFELATGEELAFLQTDTFSLLIGLQDRVLQYASDDSLRLLDAANFNEIALLPLRVSELRERPYAYTDGSFLLGHRDNHLIIRIDGNTGAEISRFISEEVNFYSYKFSPDLRFFLNTSWFENEMISNIWDAASGEPISLPANLEPLSPYFYYDSSLIAWDSDTSVVVFYDIANETILKQFPMEYDDGTNRIETVNLSFDTRYIFIDSEYYNLVWSIADEREVYRVSSEVWDSAFSPSGDLFAYQDYDGRIHIVNLVDGSTISQICEYEAYIYFTSDSILVVWDAYYDTNRHYDVSSGEAVAAPAPLRYPISMAGEFRFFRDEMRIRLEDDYDTILVYLPIETYVSAINISSDATRLYMSHADGRLSIWAVVE